MPAIAHPAHICLENIHSHAHIHMHIMPKITHLAHTHRCLENIGLGTDKISKSVASNVFQTVQRSSACGDGEIEWPDFMYCLHMLCVKVCVGVCLCIYIYIYIYIYTHTHTDTHTHTHIYIVFIKTISMHTYMHAYTPVRNTSCMRKSLIPCALSLLYSAQRSRGPGHVTSTCAHLYRMSTFGICWAPVSMYVYIHTYIHL